MYFLDFSFSFYNTCELLLTESYMEPSPKSTIELFTRIVNGF